MAIRFYLTLLQLYIDFYKSFDKQFLYDWTNKIKPFIIEKFPQTLDAVFTVNSDIHNQIKKIEDSLIQKTSPKKLEDSKSLISVPENKTEKKNQKIEKDKEEEIKQLRNKNKDKISNFLIDFINTNDFNKKRASSMMSLRNSKTISSFTTCDDSICLEEKKGKYKINLSLLIIDNSELYQQSKRTKEIVQKSLSIYQNNLSQKPETKENKKKFGKIIGLQQNLPNNLLIKMYPQYKEIEEINEKNNIEFDNDKKIINISLDLLLKKIIFEDFINKNLLIIKHFSQQCFCFVDIDIFFKKIFHCYKVYKNKGISLDKLKNLIEFINILIVEMFEYYNVVNYNEMKISLIKKFYNELINDLIINFKEKQKIVKDDKIPENQIKINDDIIINKRKFRFNSFDLDEDNSCNIGIFDKKNLLKMNIHFEERNINVYIFDEKKEQKNTNEIDNNKINSKTQKFYQISKTRKKPQKIPSLIKNKKINKIEDEIKEVINEENSVSSSSSSSSSSEENNAKSEEDEINIEKDNIIEEELPEDTKSSSIINNMLNKVFNLEPDIISERDEIMFKIKNILSLFNIKNGEEIQSSNIETAKSVISFYTNIKTINKNLLKMNKKENENFKKRKSYTFFNSILIKSNAPNNTPIKNYFCITDYTTEEIGDKLTQISISLLNKIHPKELYRGVYLKKDKGKLSPNVLNCINNFNKLTFFIIEDIISYDTPKLRAKIYEKWVQVCEYCRIKRNYNDCLARYSALNNYIITGLNLTLKEIKSKTKNLFGQISKFCSIDRNYRNIRNNMNICEQNGENFIPYLGMLLRDINFVEESSKYFNEKGFINIGKIEKINNLIEKYFKYKKDENNIINKKITKNLDFFERLEKIQEEELEKIASNIEPEFKYENQETKRLTKNDINFFQKMNKKINKRRTSFNPEPINLFKK